MMGHPDNQTDFRNSDLVNCLVIDQGCNNCKVCFDPEFRKQFYSRCSRKVYRQFLLNRLCIHHRNGSKAKHFLFSFLNSIQKFNSRCLVLSPLKSWQSMESVMQHNPRDPIALKVCDIHPS